METSDRVAPRLTIRELARELLAATTGDRAVAATATDDVLRPYVRTIRYYISLGLLPRPEQRGRPDAYTEDHLLRLRLVRLLTGRGVSLAELQDRLAPLTTHDARALLAAEEERDRRLRDAADEPSPRAYLAARLERPAQQVELARSPEYSDEPRRDEDGSTAPPHLLFERAQPLATRGEPAPSPLWTVAAWDARPAEPEEGPPSPYSDPQPMGAASSTRPAPSGEASWKRWELAPGVELHVRQDAGEQQQSLARRILRFARAKLGNQR